MKLKTRLFITYLTAMILPTVVTVVSMHFMEPKHVWELQQMFLLVIFITASLLIIWIYRAISIPLHKLQKAARNIKEGNLDFELEYDEKDESQVQMCHWEPMSVSAYCEYQPLATIPVP